MTAKFILWALGKVCLYHGDTVSKLRRKKTNVFQIWLIHSYARFVFWTKPFTTFFYVHRLLPILTPWAGPKML